jgi:two-component system response regulator AdeR
MDLEGAPGILIVEDEPDLAALYADWLADEYAVEVANTAADATATLDETIDIVLLDRRLSDGSGDSVLATIRERGFSCRVAMVTAVEADFDIIELGFDDYLVKPVTSEALCDAVDRLLRRKSYNQELQEFFALASTKAVLEAEKTTAELAASDRYARLEREFVDARERLDSLLVEFDHDDFEAIFRDLRDVPLGDG